MAKVERSDALLKKSGIAYVRMEEQAAKGSVSKGKPFVLTTYELPHLVMRQMFKRIEEFERSPQVHVMLFRRCMRRLADMFDNHMVYDKDAFASPPDILMQWADVNKAIQNGHTPSVKLNCAQTIFVALEKFETSWVAVVWYLIANVAIISNVTVIVLMSLDHYRNDQKAKETVELINTVCVCFFIADYFIKAFCVLWCPIVLFDDYWLLEHVLPSARTVADSVVTSKSRRFWYWFTCAPNLIDFISITPTLMTVIFESVHLPLSSLRMLRLLRVMRLLKAFKAAGTWVTTLQVLGEAFFQSIGSIMVLILYILLFSLVAGAVLFQQEPHDLEDGADIYMDVPHAFREVVQLFVGKSFSITTSLMSGFVLAGVGLFKGVIFLLPIDRLKQATKKAQVEHDQIDALRHQLVEEATAASLSDDIKWASDVACPYIRVEVYPDGGTETDKAVGMLNVPIIQVEPKEAQVVVPLHGGSVQPVHHSNRATMEFIIKWMPDLEKGLPAHVDKSGTKSSWQGETWSPHGKLVVQVVQGTYFGGFKSKRFRCMLHCPVRLYGEDAVEVFTTNVSLSGPPAPDWGSEDVITFDIRWEARAIIGGKRALESPDAAFQRQVLRLLEEQKHKLEALEKEVKSLKKE